MSEVITLEDVGLTANEYNLTLRAQEVLNRHYPGHDWFVGINQGVMDIMPGYVRAVEKNAPAGSMQTLVYTIHHTKCFSASELDKRLVEAGGAWLERLRLARGAVNRERTAALKTDYAGRHLLEA